MFLKIGGNSNISPELWSAAGQSSVWVSKLQSQLFRVIFPNVVYPSFLDGVASPELDGAVCECVSCHVISGDVGNESFTRECII